MRRDYEFFLTRSSVHYTLNILLSRRWYYFRTVSLPPYILGDVAAGLIVGECDRPYSTRLSVVCASSGDDQTLVMPTLTTPFVLHLSPIVSWYFFFLSTISPHTHLFFEYLSLYHHKCSLQSLRATSASLFTETEARHASFHYTTKRQRDRTELTLSGTTAVLLELFSLLL